MILANLNDISSILADTRKAIAIIEQIREDALHDHYLTHGRKKGSRRWTSLWLVKRKEDETEEAFAKRHTYYRQGPYGTLLLTPWGEKAHKYQTEYAALTKLARALDIIVSFSDEKGTAPKVTLNTDQISYIYKLYL